MTLIRDRVFVFTLLWIGFILAISFMEAPLKFQARSLTMPVALEVGYLVFHALNAVEIMLAVVILLITFLSAWSPSVRRLTIVIVLVLVGQTILLYSALDTRTLAIINGEEVPEAPYHLIYIGVEVAKLLLLLRLAHVQINNFVEKKLLKRS
ncbi:MAG: hypothetical protein AAF702_06515 [Chloroflexota bacterium]